MTMIPFTSGPEPEYEFQKGIGWVVKVFENLEAKTLDGVSVRLVMRQPMKGELYLSAPLRDRYGYTNHVTLRSFSRMIWRERFADLTPRKVKCKDEIMYCVVQRID